MLNLLSTLVTAKAIDNTVQPDSSSYMTYSAVVLITGLLGVVFLFVLAIRKKKQKNTIITINSPVLVGMVREALNSPYRRTFNRETIEGEGDLEK